MVATFIHKAISKSYVRVPGSGSDKEAGAIFCDLSRGSNLAAIIAVPQHVDMPRYLTAQPSTVTSTTNNKRSRTEDDTADVNKLNKRPCIDNTNQSITRASSDHTIKRVAVPVTVLPHELSSNFTPTNTRANNEPVIERQNGVRVPSDHTIKPVAVPVTVLPHELSSNFTTTANRANNAPVRETHNGARASSDYIIKHITVPVTMLPHQLNSKFIPTTTRANNEPVRETQTPSKLFINSNTVNDVTKLHEENMQLRSENANLQKQLSLFRQLIRNPQRLQSVLQSLNEKVQC